MPANETTWRNTQQLHQIFAITGVLLTISTVWMFWKDHARTWKTYQVEINDIDLKMNELRQQQYETGDALTLHQQRARELAEVKAQPLDESLLKRFLSEGGDLEKVLDDWKRAGHAYTVVSVDAKRIERGAEQLNKVAEEAKGKRAEADAAEKAADAALAEFQKKPDDKTKQEAMEQAEREAHRLNQEATQAENAAAATRGRLVSELQEVVDEARKREDKALGIRKFKNGEIDAAKATVDLAIRDALPEEERETREKRANDLVGDMAKPVEEAKAGKQTFAAFNEIYQSISAVRKALDKTLKQITAGTDAAQKRYDESLADLERLRKQEKDREEKFVSFYDQYPWVLGKKILTLPILDAFNSPRKIDNLWSDGLTQNYNFSYVRRFDRCTTCHQSLAKTLQGTSATPAFVHGEPLELVIIPPGPDVAPKP